MIEQLFNVVAPVFVCIALGWGWVKIGRPYETGLISSLVMAVGAPCLVFSTLSSLTIPFHLVGQMGSAALAVIVLGAAAGWVALHLMGFPKRAFLPPIMFANIGNMGLPLCLFAFGKPGLTLAVVVFAVFAVAQFTVGTWLYSGETRVGALMKMPIIYAVLFSLIVLATGFNPPLWILKTTELLGGFTIPMMLMTLGVSLAQLHVENIKRALSLSLLRLAVGLGAGVTVAWLLRLPWPARGVLILQSSMPAAVFNYLLAQRYDHHADDTAGVVVISTVLALIVLPLLLHFLTA
jgi:predicted permease